MSHILSELEGLYARIPPVGCPAGCSECCGPVPAARAERERLPLRGVQPLSGRRAGVCKHLDGSGRCHAYSLRPLLCRMMGASEDPKINCPHRPPCEGRLSMSETAAIMNAYIRLVRRTGGSILL